MTELYTASRLKTLHTCPRLHQYRYVLGCQTPSSDAAQFGTVGHAALEAWYRSWASGASDSRIEIALDAINRSGLAHVDQARLRGLICAYDARWGAEDWTVLAVEQEFRYELDGHTIGGKIDAIIRENATGEVWIIEHKTTRQAAEPGSPYWERLSIDTQVSIYVDGAAMLGYDVAGCIYDVLCVPRHEPLLATPTEKREYTLGKGCKLCGGKARGVQGNGRSHVDNAPCIVCAGSGWEEAPKLYAKQRAEGETPEAFEERVAADIASAPDDYLVRGKIVRLADELPRMRIDLVESIAIAEHQAATGIAPRNPDACAKFGTLCPFFEACCGRADIENQNLFPRGAAHPELAPAH